MNRVVITGIGVVSPNGVGITEFLNSLKTGASGVAFDNELANLNFSCRISAKPNLDSGFISNYFSELELRNFNADGILYGVIAGVDAWNDAGLPKNDNPDWDSGTIFGTGTSGIGKFRESIYNIDASMVKKLGSTAVLQTMNSGISAWLGGKLGLGNQVTTNSSACTTGTESLLMGFDRVSAGSAKRMLCGSTSDSGPYIWAGFDAMKVCTFKHNDDPERGSRPISASASGFVPGSGAAAFVVESLDSALERKADIYCEILGGNINSGGQRGAGSMTAPNPEAVQKCISDALKNSGIHPKDVDAINGHLTATSKDSLEILNWSAALGREGTDFPMINSLKGMTGHCLSAAGSIESAAAILELKHQFMFPNINCEDIHPEISAIIDPDRIVRQSTEFKHSIKAKASFGFGDVNACIILKKYDG